jgi:hypothetical protein
MAMQRLDAVSTKKINMLRILCMYPARTSKCSTRDFAGCKNPFAQRNGGHSIPPGCGLQPGRHSTSKDPDEIFASFLKAITPSLSETLNTCRQTSY